MCSQVVHQKLLTCCSFLLLDERPVGWEPEVVVRINMGVGEAIGSGSTLCRGTRAGSAEHVDTVDHGEISAGSR
jgi:hypothetical protein